MTSKDLYIAIKTGKTLDDIITKYQFKDKEELFRIIRHIAPHRAKTFIREIYRNQKRARR